MKPQPLLYQGYCESLSLIDLVQAQFDVKIDTTDLQNVAVIHNRDSDNPDYTLYKGSSVELRHILDGTILINGMYTNMEEQDYNVEIVIGSSIYKLDSSSGYFSRERNGETVVSKLESSPGGDWLRQVLRLCQVDLNL